MVLTARLVAKLSALGVVIALIVGGFFVYRSDWNQGRVFMEFVASRTAVDRAGIEQLMTTAREWEQKANAAVDSSALVEAARHWKTMGDAYALEYPRQKAIALYEEAINRFGDNPTIYAAIGDTYKALAKYEEAEENYQRAITIEPGQYTHYQKLATLYRYRMQAAPDKVLAVYAAALERLIIGSPEIYKERANYFEELGSYKAAAADWQAVVQLDPTNTGAKSEYDRLTALAAQQSAK